MIDFASQFIFGLQRFEELPELPEGWLYQTDPKDWVKCFDTLGQCYLVKESGVAVPWLLRAPESGGGWYVDTNNPVILSEVLPIKKSMKVLKKLMKLFSGRLDSFTLVDVDLEPFVPGSVTYAFPVRKGVQMEVSFREVHECESPEVIGGRPAQRFASPDESSVMDSIQELYGMIATNGSVLFTEEGGSDE